MEEPKATEPVPPPPPTTTTTTPQTHTQTTKKRPLDSDDSHFNYFKLRALIRDLRPHFIQVLRTPDYKNCKESHEIREQLKIVMKLYDKVKADTVSLKKSKTMQDGQNMDHQIQQDQQPQHVKPSERSEKAFARPSETKLTTPVSGGLQKPQPEEGQMQGSYVVGGSAFGWNFITFSGQDPVYYGRTKERFRSAKVTE